MKDDVGPGGLGGGTGVPGSGLPATARARSPAPLQRLGLLQSYYLATPLFLAVDLVFGAPVRASFLPDIETRLAYYAFTFGCGVLCFFKPRTGPWVGIAESSVNLIMLLLSILLPIWAMLPDPMASSLELPYDATPMVNFALSGMVIIYAFHRSEAAVERRRRRRAKPWTL